MLCVDANIWVYYFDSETTEHEDVLPEMTDVLEHDRVFTNTAIQMEVVHYFVKQVTDSRRYIDRFIELDRVTSAKLT